MKVAFFAIFLGLAGMANAGTMSTPTTSLLSATSGAATPSFQAANRKGSTRVGGSGKSGKGSRYVGGRRK